MKLIKNTAAVGLLGSAILAGYPADAKAAPDLNALAETLGLPIGKTVSHFNRATGAAFTEQCVIKNDKAIECKVQLLNNTAQIDAKSVHRYSFKEDGSMAINVLPVRSAEWSTTTYHYDFQPAKRQGEGNIISWDSNSPLYTKSQNDTGQIAIKDSSAVDINSVTPVSGNRGMKIGMTFDEASGAVSGTIMPMVAVGDKIITPANVPATQRDFDSYDSDVQAIYAKKAAASAFFIGQ